jgi:preprotein translocase subunit YajC
MKALLIIILIFYLVFGIFLFVKYREIKKQSDEIKSSINNDDIKIWNEFNEIHKKD